MFRCLFIIEQVYHIIEQLTFAFDQTRQTEEKKRVLRSKEVFWQKRLNTFAPNGLNKREGWRGRLCYSKPQYNMQTAKHRGSNITRKWWKDLTSKNLTSDYLTSDQTIYINELSRKTSEHKHAHSKCQWRRSGKDRNRSLKAVYNLTSQIQSITKIKKRLLTLN